MDIRHNTEDYDFYADEGSADPDENDMKSYSGSTGSRRSDIDCNGWESSVVCTLGYFTIVFHGKWVGFELGFDEHRGKNVCRKGMFSALSALNSILYL